MNEINDALGLVGIGIGIGTFAAMVIIQVSVGSKIDNLIEVVKEGNRTLSQIRVDQARLLERLQPHAPAEP